MAEFDASEYTGTSCQPIGLAIRLIPALPMSTVVSAQSCGLDINEAVAPVVVVLIWFPIKRDIGVIGRPIAQPVP